MREYFIHVYKRASGDQFYGPWVERRLTTDPYYFPMIYRIRVIPK